MAYSQASLLLRKQLKAWRMRKMSLNGASSLVLLIPFMYPNGKVCISILHPSGDDANGYELATERWNPVRTVESIVLSIISMLSSPNDESPADVEAAEEWRENRDGFKKKVRDCVRKSQEML